MFHNKENVDEWSDNVQNVTIEDDASNTLNNLLKQFDECFQVIHKSIGFW